MSGVVTRLHVRLATWSEPAICWPRSTPASCGRGATTRRPRCVADATSPRRRPGAPPAAARGRAPAAERSRSQRAGCRGGRAAAGAGRGDGRLRHHPGELRAHRRADGRRRRLCVDAGGRDRRRELRGADVPHLLDLTRLGSAYVDRPTSAASTAAARTPPFTVDTYGDAGFAGRVTTRSIRGPDRDNVVNYVAVIRFTQVPERTLRPDDCRRPAAASTRAAACSRCRCGPCARTGRKRMSWAARRRLVRRHIRLGARDDSYGEIVDGLAEGDEVAIGGREGRRRWR